ncbi:MAG: hypothetical protein GY852_01805 [bacterium]|nr:hypothetical protein [bacterium]
MAIMVCDRCGEQTAKLDDCNYCKKTCCNLCVKSSKRVGKGGKAYICKDCWSRMDKRKRFKSA